ncbi:hypothetical protein HanRHA438_Chr10g0457511 [Helianthus annuus]|uniref:Uncharacterized protein n=1 Tax=Helianthus annuus TaxID=4232 RepID=A0A251TJ23_HELAN|nr:hypothetical protein HanXRQr2_Chr10g0445001 [Helianthus annuus]KAJ0514143.1 hypothetical protein HanHA300_Chr10g0366031 [Helianthus annuus]KAJ0697130.1 hypothetical protein HanLR1_Chr10g0365271 [Helianthus annuus]KAJ0700556.1 hypothetical protein HanOQP8_Chr10g0369141 [Helianthus annuus]KAJ0744030.1 hypothetical protein HanPI659440_Chr10g0382721 [Helianthus annuus]
MWRIMIDGEGRWGDILGRLLTTHTACTVPTSFTWTSDDPTSGSVFQTSFQVLIISTNIDYIISKQTCAGEGFRCNVDSRNLARPPTRKLPMYDPIISSNPTYKPHFNDHNFLIF